MNKKQAAKMELLKKALMAISFDWTTAIYKRNEQVVFEGDLMFTDGLNVWTLTGGSHGLLVLSHGDTRHTIGFIEEYNTAQAAVMAQAEAIDAKVRKLVKG
jgi:hypothetical protein